MSEYTFRDWCIVTGNERYLVDVYKGSVNCNNSKITSLEGAPKVVTGTFNCYNCVDLVSLEGAPRELGGNFNCYGCTSLKSLEGGPVVVKGDFFCNECNNLISLKGAPKEVGGTFFCKDCENLISLEDGIKHLKKLDFRGPLEIIVLSDIFNHKYDLDTIKDSRIFKNMYNELKGLSGDEFESKCMDLAEKLGYELIPEDLKDILLVDCEPFEKI